eukprot:1023519-Pyramimonas_sp.AAC.1
MTTTARPEPWARAPAAGLPHNFPIGGDMRKKDVFAQFVSKQVVDRALLDKGDGFFNSCMENEILTWKPPHCAFSVVHGAAASSGEAGAPLLRFVCAPTR